MSLVDKVLEEIGENLQSPDVFITPSDKQPIVDAMNLASTIIAIASGFKTEKLVINFSPNKILEKVTIPFVHAGIRGATLNGRPLEVTSFLRRKHASNYSPSLLVYGFDYFGLSPCPSVASSVEAEFFILPEDGSIRDEFVHALVNYAIMDFHASRGDVPNAEVYMKKVFDLIGIKTLQWRDATNTKVSVSKYPETGFTKPSL